MYKNWFVLFMYIEYNSFMEASIFITRDMMVSL